MSKKKIIITILVLFILCLSIFFLKPILFKSNLETIENNNNIIEINLNKLQDIDNYVKISGNNIYINNGGKYNISGILQNGTIYVDTKDEIIINLNNVTMTNEDTNIINNRKSSKLVINLEENTNNILSDGANSDAVIKSSGDLYIEGSGKLLIYANNKDGINSNSNLIINNGVIYIAAKNDALVVTKELLINGGNFIGLGNKNMKEPNELSKQNTLLLNFTESFPENFTFSLVDNSNKYLLNFISLKEFKTLILSNRYLKNGAYHILSDVICYGEAENGIYEKIECSGGNRINIGITDTFNIKNKSNWYGKKEINIITPDNFV